LFFSIGSISLGPAAMVKYVLPFIYMGMETAGYGGLRICD